MDLGQSMRLLPGHCHTGRSAHTSTMPDNDQDVLVLDMTTLRFRMPGSATGPMRVTSHDNLALATVWPRRNESRADLAFRGMDAALRSARIPSPTCNPRQRRYLQLALYNPHSGDIAVGAVGATVCFAGDEPVVLPPGGALGHIQATGETTTLSIGQQQLTKVDRGRNELTRVIASQA